MCREASVVERTSRLCGEAREASGATVVVRAIRVAQVRGGTMGGTTMVTRGARGP